MDDQAREWALTKNRYLRRIGVRLLTESKTCRSTAKGSLSSTTEKVAS
jgi:hypothetical protein